MAESKVSVGVRKVPIHLQSSQNRICIKGGTIVNDDRMYQADLYIEEGVIKQIGTNLVIPGGVRTLEAKGKLLLPGGLDAQTHLQMPLYGTVTSDDFYSGTKAALAGATTTVIDCVQAKRGESLLEAYDHYREWADTKACCDYSLHVAIPSYNDKVAKEMEVLVKDRGVNSFYLYLGCEDGDQGHPSLSEDDLLSALERCRDLGALALVHAENGKIVQRLAGEVFARGITGPEGWLYSRPEELELEATNRAIILADEINCPIHLVGLTSRSAALRLAEARSEGKLVTGETTAAAIGVQSTENPLLNPNWRQAAGHVTSHPLRPSAACSLLRLLGSGGLDCVVSSHCVYRTEQRALGKDDFRKIPPGVNGVEDRMSVLWEKGVTTGILDPCQFVAVTSTNAAKLFNLYPRKGKLEIGADADIVIWNPSAVRVISANQHHQSVDMNVFEGLSCHGVPEVVIATGKVVLETSDGLRVTQGAGRFLSLTPFAQAVYGRAKVKEQTRQQLLKPVDRALYTGPVTATVQPAANGSQHDGDTNETKAEQQQEGGAVPTQRPPTSSGARNLHDSTFSLSGAQVDDSRPIRSTIRTKQPPGGSSTTSLW